MSKMIEHVARALQNAALAMENKPEVTDRDWEAIKRIPTLWKRLETSSRAAIEAMREPTDEMASAALALDRVEHGVLVTAGPHDVWSAMIDAAVAS